MSKSNMTAKAISFTLLDTSINITEERANYINLVTFCEKISKGVYEQYSAKYKSVSDIRTLFNKTPEWLSETLKKPISQILDFYVRNNIYDVSAESIEIELTSESEFGVGFQELYDKAMMVYDKEQDQKEMREIRKANRSYWEGGGFGLSGAIKGAATAGALNAASGVGHSIMNGIGNIGSALERDYELNNLLKEYSDKLPFALQLAVANYYIRMIPVLEKKANWTISPIYSSDVEQSENMISTLSNRSLSEEQKKEIIFKIIDINPLQKDIYKYVFKTYDVNEKKNILKISDYFHIDMSDSIENYLLPENRINQCTSLNKAIEIKDHILKSQKELGISHSEAQKSIEKRIYELTFEKFKNDISSCTDETKLPEILSKVASSDLHSDDKGKLNKAADEKITKLRTFEGIVFESQEEVTIQRDNLNTINAMIDSINSLEDAVKVEKELESIVLHQNLKNNCIESLKCKIESFFVNRIDKISDKESAIQIIEELSDSIIDPSKKAELTQKAKQRILTFIYPLDANVKINDEKVLRNLHAKITEEKYVEEELKSEYYNSIEEKLAKLMYDKVNKNSEQQLNDLANKISQDIFHNNIKTKYADIIKTAINRIWAREDSEELDKMLLELDIKDKSQIAAAFDKVEKMSRTDDKNKYLKALGIYNSGFKMFRVKRYIALKNKGFFITFIPEIIVFILSVTIDLPEYLGLILFYLPIISVVMTLLSKKTWEAATINGRAVHPSLEIKKKNKP